MAANPTFTHGTNTPFPLLSVEEMLQHGQQLIKDIEHDRAIAQFQEVLAIAPDNVTALNHLGFILLVVGKPREALSIYRQGLRLSNQPDFLNGMANCYKSMGDFTKARSYYEKGLQLQPDNIYCLYNIALMGNADAAITRQLHSLHQRLDIVGQLRALLCFALGKIYEGKKDHQCAFQYYDEANRLQSALIWYDEKMHFAFFDRVQANFSAPFPAEKLKHAGPIPIFVLGMPRSGTSLVEQILASHSKVYGAGEADIMPYVAEKMIPRLTGHVYPEAVQMLNTENITELREYYLDKLQSYCPNKSPYIATKTLLNFFHVGLIRRLFPGAPIIHCTRDPMDTCWSIFREYLVGNHNYCYNQETLGRYHRRYQQIMQHWHQVFPGEIYDVQYEQLIEQPEQVTRALLEHCQLPWEGKCMRFYRTNRNVITASAQQVRRPIYKNSLKSWEPVAEKLAPLRAALQG